jgi:hypothetical protein
MSSLGNLLLTPDLAMKGWQRQHIEDGFAVLAKLESQFDDTMTNTEKIKLLESINGHEAELLEAVYNFEKFYEEQI